MALVVAEPCRGKRIMADPFVTVSELQACLETPFTNFGSRDLTVYLGLAGVATEWRGGIRAVDIAKVHVLVRNILMHCKNGAAPIKRLELAIIACRSNGKVDFTHRTDEDHASREGGSTFVDKRGFVVLFMCDAMP